MILATRDGNQELRVSDLASFGIRDEFSSGGTGAGVTINSKTAGGIPAVTQAVRMAAEAVASTDLGVWRGKGVNRSAVSTTWQSRFFDTPPSDQQSAFEFWEAAQESIDYRGNAYIWVNQDAGQVTEWFALHPDQVTPYWTTTGKKRFYVMTAAWWIDPVGKGQGWYDVGAETILHIRGFGEGGAWIAPSPLERERDALKAALSKVRYEGKLYDNSANPSIVVSYPGELTQEQMNDYREAMQGMYGGPDRAGRIGVTGGGATIAKVGLTLADAQFVESMQFDVEQVARIFNWEASLLGGGTAGTGIASGPKTPEHELARLLRHRLVPRFKRIESALLSFPALFPRGARDYPMFNTDRALRGDLQTEANISLTKVQSGQWTRNEARALDGMPPVEGGDTLQITPVGGAPNPEPPPAEG